MRTLCPSVKATGQFKQRQILTEEDQDGADPLHRTHDIPEENNRAEDGEELPGSGDDGAGQRPEVHHRHEDERLVKKKSK